MGSFLRSYTSATRPTSSSRSGSQYSSSSLEKKAKVLSRLNENDKSQPLLDPKRISKTSMRKSEISRTFSEDDVNSGRRISGLTNTTSGRLFQ